MSVTLKRLFLLMMLVSGASAHVGSPDIYLDGSAGPYKLSVTVRPPQVIPGVAEIEVRSQTAGIRELKVVPLPLFGVGAEHPPIPEALHRAADDSQFFTGSLWLMADGSWQVRLSVDGTQGPATLSIPVPAVAKTTRAMEWQLGLVLAILGVFLVGGLSAICGAAVRDATLPAGTEASEAAKRKSLIATAIAFCVIALVLWAGKSWWDSEVEVYKRRIYKPLQIQAQLESSSLLRLSLSEPGWMQPPPNSARFSRVLFVRKMDDLVMDHNHLMHLYVVREPGLDVIYHLHPQRERADEFRVALPKMPAGDYNLYADVVHENGLPETMTAKLHLPEAIAAGGRPLVGDDARAETQPIDAGTLGDTFALPDGYRMHWIRDSAPLPARQAHEFRFELLNPDGSKPKDMALYMGMLGHSAFVKDDGSVFAHIHPNGTVSMAALMLAQGGDGMAGMDHSQMHMENLPGEVSFPYGLPTPGKYRIFVQMKHGETVETGVFDATAK